MSGDTLELAALAYAWELWARPKQLAPPTNWRSWGFVAGRGFGKTRACAELLIEEVRAGRARRVGFCSFKEDEAERTLIHGESGLINVSPPWFKPEVIKGQVVWPNGAIATPFTPEVPDGPRGPEHDLFWCSEVAAWPAATRDEFFKNIREGLRIGLARMIFDTTPKARNPLVRYLLQRASRDPQRHLVVRGATRENRDNLADGFVSELEADYAGTQRARQELEGEFFDDAEGALFKQHWIDHHRRSLPPTLKRRVLSIDPAISVRKGTDETGIVDVALGADDQVFVIEDLTDRYAPEAWAKLLIDRYFEVRADCIVFERNRGGDLVVSNVRAYAMLRKIRVEVVDAKATTRHVAGVIYAKELVSRKSKALRAEPVATLYERGRVSHVPGGDLGDLEDVMTTWVPEESGDSPNALDAMVHGVFEIAGLHGREHRDPSALIHGAVQMQEAIGRHAPPAPAGDLDLMSLLGAGSGSDKI